MWTIDKVYERWLKHWEEYGHIDWDEFSSEYCDIEKE